MARMLSSKLKDEGSIPYFPAFIFKFCIKND